VLLEDKTNIFLCIKKR